MILNFSSVIRQYLKVLREVSNEYSDVVYQDCCLICSLKTNSSVSSMMRDSYLTVYYKRDIYNVLRDSLSSSVMKSFIEVLIEENRLHLLQNICDDFVRDFYKDEDTRDLTVYTAYPMSDVIKKSFADWFESYLKYKFIIHNHVDSSLVGGFIVQYGTYCFDMSIKHDVDRINSLMRKGNVA